MSFDLSDGSFDAVFFGFCGCDSGEIGFLLGELGGKGAGFASFELGEEGEVAVDAGAGGVEA